jgi:predicted helicase
MEVSSNFLSGCNIGLVFMRQVASQNDYTHFGITRHPVDNRAFYSNRGTMSFAPLYLYNSGNDNLFDISAVSKKVPNLSKKQVLILKSNLEISEISPEEILYYVYAIFHSNEYRQRFADFIRVDFPRVPPIKNEILFRNLVQFGKTLGSLHLMESKKLDNYITTVVGTGQFQVTKVSYSDQTVWIDKQKKHGFKDVPKAIWDYEIGGYQVCFKWLKDRQAKGGKNPGPGRILTKEDLDHYQRIIVALNETNLIMNKIDDSIEQHGGWPNAFT